VTPSRSYVALERDAVRVRFGFFERRFPRERIVGARRIPRKFWYGIGWHTDFRRMLTVNGSLGGQIELELAAPERLRLLGLPARCTRPRVSLSDLTPSGRAQAHAR
jgi:hypothetical protein